MNKSPKKVPELRFKGFTDDWEQRKLGDLADIVRGASPRPIQDPKWFDEDSEIGWLRISDVTKQDGRIHYLKQKISEAGQEKTRVLVDTHLLLSIAATVGKPVINYVKTGVHDGFLIFMNPKFNHEYMFQWLEMFRPRWQRYGQPGSQVNLNSDLVKNHKMMIPSIKEQNKISELLKKTDTTIALHQRKHDVLLRLKEAYLQNVFPKNEESLPKLRFANFKGDWEQRKLGEVGDFIRTSVDPQSFPDDKFIEYSMPSFDNDRSPKEVLGKTMQSNRLKITGNVLLINKLNIRQKRIWLIKNANKNAVASSEFMPYTSKQINLGFIEQLMLTDKTTRRLESLSSGTSNSQKRIAPSDLLTYKILSPKSENEQRKISSILKQLDNVINLQQQKIKQIQKLKKAYLQKMFL